MLLLHSSTSPFTYRFTLDIMPICSHLLRNHLINISYLLSLASSTRKVYRASMHHLFLLVYFQTFQDTSQRLCPTHSLSCHAGNNQNPSCDHSAAQYPEYSTANAGYVLTLSPLGPCPDTAGVLRFRRYTLWSALLRRATWIKKGPSKITICIYICSSNLESRTSELIYTLYIYSTNTNF